MEYKTRNNMPEAKLFTLYMCNPDKNTSCLKHNCFYNSSSERNNSNRLLCKSTRELRYAKLDKNGEPIICAKFLEGISLTGDRVLLQIDNNSISVEENI